MKRIKGIVIIMLILLLVWIIYSLFSHRFREPQQTFGQTLKVMTYNTHAMMIGETLASKKAMLKYLNKQDADVICLQEVLVYKNPNRLTLNALRAEMSNYPYTYFDFKRYNNVRQFGNVVFSRYPLKNKNTIRYESQSNISSQCDVLVNGDTIRLIVNHLESYGLEKEDLQLDTLSMEGIKNSSLMHKLHDAGLLRKQQAKEVKQQIRQSPHPVVVVGDFNAIPLSYVYWKIRLGLRDCFLASSWGRLGNTYKKGPIAIRIDYILCSRKLTPIKCEVDRVKYSDHFPVCATIGW
jgi:endonuclease/exonuclease/phosphatase family metal-dependent hydrolase